MKIGMRSRVRLLLVLGALAACGEDDPSQTARTLDVTAGNAANIVDDTAQKIDAAVQQNTRALDAAIEAQSKGEDTR